MARLSPIGLFLVLQFAFSRMSAASEDQLLILADRSLAQASLVDRFATELALLAENTRVTVVENDITAFSALSEEQKLEEADAKLQGMGGLCLVWLETTGESVRRIGLLVSAEGGTLARTVSFENSITFMPEMALIVTELLEHALMYESEERARNAEVVSPVVPSARKEASGAVVASFGLGSRIPAPDGWKRLTTDKSPVATIEKVEEVEGTPEDAKKEGAAEGETSESGEAPDAPTTDKGVPEEEEKTQDATSAPGSEKPATTPHDAGKAFSRRFALEPIFSFVQGLGPYNGSAIWLGGGAAFSIWSFSPLLVKIALVVHGGPLPRYDENDLIGWRLLPAVSVGYLFDIASIGLGPTLEAAGMVTKIAVDEAGYVPVAHRWGGFRVSLGGRFVAPMVGRISFTFSALFGVWATKGKRFVRGDDGGKIFTSALGELTADVGILFFL